MNPYDFAEIKKCSLNRVFDFTSSVNPLGPSHKAEHAVRKEAGRLEAFADSKARYLKRYLCKTGKIGEDRIIFGAGSTHLLKVLMDSAAPGSIGMISPASPRLDEVPDRHKRLIKFIPLHEDGGFAVPVERLCEEMKGLDMVVVENPHHMTGAALSGDELRLLISEAGKTGTALVIDEAMRDYTDLDSPVQEAVESPSTIILRTFSHYYALAGLRLGYAIGPARLVEKMGEARPWAEIGALALHAAQAALKDREYKARTVKLISEEKAYFSRKLSGLPGVEILDTPCNFVLLRVKGEWERIYKSLEECHIIVTGFSGSDGSAYVRLPVGRHKSNAYFARTLRRITGG